MDKQNVPDPGVVQHSDKRDSFARISSRVPKAKVAEQTFIRGKLHMLRTHPMVRVHRAATIRTFANRMRDSLALLSPSRPVPGGVGYGVFYQAPYKTGFATGTSIVWDIVCPAIPGGSVSDWLYITATNRSALGVEAFVAYHGQNDTTFNVFDWARADNDHWQLHIPFAELPEYLSAKVANGTELPVLSLVNTTTKTGDGTWTNTVALWNKRTEQWDKVYNFEYASSLAQQLDGWVGSWGPIVETFEDSYEGTNNLGALNTRLAARDTAGNWSPWQLLTPSLSEVRVDNKAFELAFIQANHTWAVVS